MGQKLFQNEDPNLMSTVVDILKNDIKKGMKRSMTTKHGRLESVAKSLNKN